MAHIYGQNIVAAESFTTVGFGGNGWNYYPSKLKAAADQELYGGVNRFAIHESGHQPVDDKVPGLGVLITGQWFNRHETWAEQAKAWSEYLGRSSALLQQGKYVADVLYYYGEDNNITNIFNQGKFPMMPEGYSFDFTNAEALINDINPSNGSLTTKTGMRYRVLVLNNSASVKNMSLPVLRKIDEIARAGVLICGARPETDASLSDDKAEFNRLVDDIWNSGRANVSTSTDVASLLRAKGIGADFSYDKSTTDPLRFVHRHVSNGDIYWVNKPSDNTCTASATFRVSGKRPEIWHPETGLREAASYEMGDGSTTVTIPMVQNDAVFVVFTDDTADRSYTVAPKTDTDIATVKGPWSVSFVSKAVTPQPTTMQALASLSSSSDRDIKYFSGTASYANTVKLSKSQLKAGRIILDLGKVCNLAEVIVNGRILGTVWKALFRVDITDAVKAGKNSIVIKVTDSWANRLIGDQQPDTMNKSTYTSFNFYNAKSPLNDAGLVGPVKLLSEKAE